MAAANPAQADPVKNEPITPASAAMSMMPSADRWITPAASDRVMPSAASAMGVVCRRAAASKLKI
jgi:hypothetical protein